MTIRLRSSSNTEIRIRPQLQTWPSLSDAGFGVHPKFGGIGVPVVQTNFTTTSSLPSWISFSRTSNATLYDSTGKLTYAPNNRCLYSEQFDDAWWAKTNVTVTANSAVAPDGSMTADTLTANAANGEILKAANAGAGTYISSIWIKRKTGTGQIQLVSLDGARVNVAQTVTSTEWTRCYLLGTGALSNTYIGVRLVASGDEVYLWGAQLEAVTYQTTPSTYVATTTAAYYGPRFDYDPSTLAAKGLLIEEQRVNILTYSEQFNNAAWTKSAATITANATTSPDGTSSADKLVDDTTATTAHYVTRSGITVTNATAYTLTVYAKAAGRNFVVVQLGSAYAWFNLSTGAIGTTVPATTGTFAISNVGNGWYRCSVTWTTTSTTTFATIYNASADNVFNYTGDGTSGVFLWGAQLEAGSFATSYIPTTSASVTRAADVAQLTGSALTTLQATSFSAGIECLSMSTGNYILLAGPSGAGALLYTNSNTSAGTYDPLSSPTSANVTAGTGGFLTIGRTFVSNNASGRSAVMNNGTVGTAGTLVTARSVVQIGAYSTGTAYNNGWYRSFAAYNQRLPDAILKQKSAVGAPY